MSAPVFCSKCGAMLKISECDWCTTPECKKVDLPFDPSKPCQTRDGREVRIYATDGQGSYPIHGSVKYEKGGWSDPQTWTKSGLYNANSNLDSGWDLVNIPKPKIKQKIWILVDKIGPPINDYSYRVCLIPLGEEEDTVAIIPIELEFSEGEGL